MISTEYLDAQERSVERPHGLHNARFIPGFTAATVRDPDRAAQAPGRRSGQ
jgi:hypothetical protein